MVNVTDPNYVQNLNLNPIIDNFIKVVKLITNQTINLLSQTGFTPSVRWTSMLLTAIGIGLIFLALKITKPLLKYALIILSVILIVGMLIPW